MIIYAIGFNAMFLGNVLFLTRVWDYSILRAGLAISVGPLIVAVTAPLFGRLAGRIGQRTLLVPGGLLWAAGGALLLARATTTPDYLGVYLPAIVCTALGVALCLPAAVVGRRAGPAGRPVRRRARPSCRPSATSAPRSASPSSSPSPRACRATPLDGFHHVWWLLVGCGVAVSVLSSRLVRLSAPVAPAVVAATAH